MSVMVERVARAICIASGSNPDRGYNIVDDGRRYWLHFEHIARAAIDAMREPTAEMLDAVKSDKRFPPYRWDVFADAWRVMIATILNPSK